jgi:hypothetical protein
MSKRKNLERPVAVKEVLEGLIRPGDWHSLEVRHQVRAVWEQTVPRRLREQCRLVDLKRRELWVEAGSSALVQELHFLRPQILAALDRALGAGVVKEVRFQVGSGG